MISTLYVVDPYEFKKLLLDTKDNKNLKLDWTMFYVSNEFKSYVYDAYYLCQFLKNKTSLSERANQQIDSYISDYEDLMLAYRIDNSIINRIDQHEIEISAKKFINKYFMEIKFPETNTSTIKDTKLVQIDLEKLFTKNYDYNRIINVDFNSAKFNAYILYEIETMMSNLCETIRS